MKIKISLLFLLISQAIYADDKSIQIQERMNDQHIQKEYQLEHPKQNNHINIPENNANNQQISLTRQELIQQPNLLNSAMLSALAMNHIENILFLLPIYQQLPQTQQNSEVLQWAKAIEAKADQDYTKAIQLYRNLIASYPEHQIIRMQLAVALFENRETEAAEAQFHKLQADKLPPQITQIITGYLEAISKQDKWNLQGGLTYLNDPNINNAPASGTRYGNWIAPKRESAQGIGFYFEADKKWSWGNGFFHQFRLNTNGKYYWNNKKYNEYSLRESIGIGYQTAKQRVTFSPFLEQVWYSGGSRQSESAKRYSNSGGINSHWRYWLTPQWQAAITYEYAEQRYTRRQHLDGNYHFVAPSLYFYPNSQQYWFLGANFNRTSTRDLDDSFIRRGISVGWGQEWKNGLLSQLSLSYAKKQYRADMPIFDLTQRNKEYSVQTSLWHRGLHFWGITPRLTWHYTKVKSNHSFYSYDKNRVYLEFSHTF
ncbi:porin family protein [Mannheimia sp. AT1]|uniref:Porin family protein n=1 Tax=Mannheimia cairinae TaxID=3025936 RepID=A0ABT5MQ53_9PAST|nr:porin family protein [Mannheimia cairinae]MDD0824305.1 porin family protein [Mannheimia cairinae]MDD0826572.1 porin family protein [Mannheimia cairinae]